MAGCCAQTLQPSSTETAQLGPLPSTSYVFKFSQILVDAQTNVPLTLNTLHFSLGRFDATGVCKGGLLEGKPVIPIPEKFVRRFKATKLLSADEKVIIQLKRPTVVTEVMFKLKRTMCLTMSISTATPCCALNSDLRFVLNKGCPP